MKLGVVDRDEAAGVGPDPISSSRDQFVEQLYRLHGSALMRFLVRLTYGDRAAAEDLHQETVLRAWRYLHGHAIDVERVRPWLFTVARHIVIDEIRAGRSRPTEVVVADITAFPSLTDGLEMTLNAHAVRSGLMELSVHHRRVLIEMFFNDRSVVETAAALGIPEGTVKSRAFYAMRALRNSSALAEQRRRSGADRGATSTARSRRKLRTSYETSPRCAS